MGNPRLKALLFSGGVDSLAIAHWCKPDFLLTIDYGQVTAQSEIRAASALAKRLVLPHEVLTADVSGIGTGTLSRNPSVANSPHAEWWPYRNQLLITLAATWALPKGISTLQIGTVKGDECFSDGTPAFITAINHLLAMQEGAVKVEAPALGLESLELIIKSELPTDLLPLCFSCNVSKRPCGACRSCAKYLGTLSFFGLV